MATWASSSWASGSWATAEADDAIKAGAVAPPSPVVSGPVNFSVADPSGPLIPGGITAFPVVHGPLSPPDPSLYGALFPGTVEGVSRVVGPFPLHYPPPSVPYGTVNRYMPITVSGYDVVSASASPEMNGVGRGSFTSTTPIPSGGDLIFSVGGVVALRGPVVAGEVSKVSEAEHAEVYSAEVEGHLREWANVVVFPDFGSGYGADNSPQKRLGAPPQDVRFFDWTMNGGVRGGLNITVGRDPREAALAADPLPLPDGWPDAGADWMWVTKPGKAAAGWCAMLRNDAPKLPGGPTAIFYCFYDSGEVWVDGVKVAETTRSGVTERIDLDLTEGYHRFNIKAHNGGGNAGVLFSAIPRSGTPDFTRAVRSGGGWLCAPSDSPPAPLTLSQVIQRLMDEARARGCLGNWNVSVVGSNFGEPSDESITLDVGMTYLDWLNRFAESWIDYYAVGRSLTIVPKGYRGGGFTVPWELGVDLVSSGTQETLP